MKTDILHKLPYYKIYIDGIEIDITYDPIIQSNVGYYYIKIFNNISIPDSVFDHTDVSMYHYFIWYYIDDTYFNKYQNKKVDIYKFTSDHIKIGYYSILNNMLHNEFGPSVIEYYSNGNIQHKGWLKYDERIRNNNAPELIRYYENGNIQFQYYFNNINRVNEKYISFYDTGELHTEMFNRESNFIEYFKNSKVKFTIKDNYSACYYDNGNIKYELWYYLNGNNKINHNEMGPAFISYTEDGIIICAYFYINGKRLTYPEWYEYYKKTPEYQAELKKESETIFD